MIPPNNQQVYIKNYRYAIIGASVGQLIGLGYAFSKKKKFWGYIGTALIGGMALGTIGSLIDMNIKIK